MSDIIRFAPVQIGDETVLVLVDSGEKMSVSLPQSEGGDFEPAALGLPKIEVDFDKVVTALRKGARQVYELVNEDLAPDEIEIAFGIAVGFDIEANTPFFSLGKVGGEASYTVVMKWNEKPEEKTAQT